MPRRPRFEEPGAIHHVYARGVEKRPIFLDDHDHGEYVDLLRARARTSRWICRAYCLMSNHVHLLVETAEPNLGPGIQWVHGQYARYFNDRHDRVGHLFQDRFGSSRLWDDAAAGQIADYIAFNPVRAGLCERPEDWRWSGTGLR